MANINKTKFIKNYGIDDDNFLAYLNKFDTFKKIVDIGLLDVISKENINHLYNRFIYYNSLGHDLVTIVEETIPDIKNLFFFNGNGYAEYSLPANTSKISSSFSRVTISDRICHVKLQFTIKQTLNKHDIIFALTPAPSIDFGFKLFNNDGVNGELKITDDGVKVNSETFPNSGEFVGTVTYIIKK